MDLETKVDFLEGLVDCGHHLSAPHQSTLQGDIMNEQLQLPEQRRRVALAVDSFIIAFNQVDLLSLMALQALCDEPYLFRMAANDWQFEQRRALVVKLLDWKRLAPTDLVETWRAEWASAQAMADQRSHIAHGQMSMLGSPDAADEERFGVASFKKAGKPDFNMKLADVEALTPAAYALVARISALVERVAACPWRDELTPRSRTAQQQP
jgi:hypothetical protein